MLGFGSSYDDLYAAGKKQLKDFQPSSATIGWAIQGLSWTDDATSDTSSNVSDTSGDSSQGEHVELSIVLGRGVLMLKFAISEATKLRNVSSFVQKSWSAGQDGLKPDAPLIAQVYSWARLSSAVQRVQNEGVEFYVDGQMTNIWSFEEAVRALGIMHLNNTASSSRLKHPITDTVSIAPYAQGQPLLELFYVRVNEIAKPLNTFFGRIYVTDSVGSVIVWTTNTTITAVTGEELVFVGPSRPLYAADEVTIGTVLLHSIAADSEIDIKFNPFDYYAGAEYDVPIIRRISQTWGSANVCYMAMTNGLYAKISVILVKKDDDINAKVYGDISAHNGFGQTLLFRKGSDATVPVKRQHAIPLSKALVATPRDKTLRVNADLYHDLGSDDYVQIAWGSVEFQPSYMRSEGKRITGASGAVEVRVTWM
ncbi:hypothetical protein D9757_006813 [Collybiopsis confluens]|uniref:DUF6598 domain-containing protein n=1 Tax=Collybiopsis confluens TaxID=2823264 RepID=A0A8H5HPT8_9AGAR|nr:hypothetical protein D9757_006813 [Collybiopsis confluens]